MQALQHLSLPKIPKQRTKSIQHVTKELQKILQSCSSILAWSMREETNTKLSVFLCNFAGHLALHWLLRDKIRNDLFITLLWY